jgi:lipopolysaccharide biosynthesis glycosyltransferase
MKPLHLASAANAAYFPGLEVLVCSTLLHVSTDTEVHFHIFDGGIGDAGWEMLHQHAARFQTRTFFHPLAFSDKRFSGFPELNGNKLAYARLLLAEALPGLDRVIYADCDIIIGRNMEELRDTDMQGRTALAAHDAIVRNLSDDCPWLSKEETKGHRYYNSGVMLLDLAQWRERNYLEQCLTAISAKPTQCRFWDQTALNYVLRDDTGLLPDHWNYVAFTSAAIPPHPVNIHLISDKPWRDPFPRFDHYVWTVFYSDFIRKCDWTSQTTTARKWLYRFPRHWLTRGLFGLVMGRIVASTVNPSARARREQMLHGGMSDFSVLKRLRQNWLRALQATRGQVTPEPVLQTVMSAPARSAS